jgi:hypothetical protein
MGTSDIDLTLLVAGDVLQGSRGGIDTWLEGVYIDAVVKSQMDFMDLEAVLADPYRATYIHRAIILSDWFSDPTATSRAGGVHGTQVDQATHGVLA